MKKLLIIKLGGSVVTDKDSPIPKARLGVIKRLAKEIAQIYRQNKYQLILVHGAGSFAHPLVKKYNLHLGLKAAEQKEALSLTHKQLMELNYLIIDSLTKNGVPAISFPPHAFIKQRNGKLYDFDYSLIKVSLEKDFVPVLFGDMVLDDILGCSVISGDVIVTYLAKNLKAAQVIFLSDVDGIYTADPKKNPEAKLIPEITNKNLKEVMAGLTPTDRDDVTGEMKGKIIMLEHTLKKLPVVIVNGLKPQTLQKALMPASIGTKILLD